MMENEDLKVIERFGISKLAKLEVGLESGKMLGQMLDEIEDVNDAIRILKRNKYDLREINGRRKRYFEEYIKK